MVIMNDAQWLDRVWKAYCVYKEQYDKHNQTVEHFVLYLYQQYGIVIPPERKQEK